jgi:hypothetical protein
MNNIRRFVIAAACFMSVAASAQWQWVDKDGRKVFSDRAPPADVLEKNIVKRPGVRATLEPSSDNVLQSRQNGSTAGAPTPPTAANVPQLSGVDKELAEKKKQAEQAEMAKRKAEDEKRLQARQENCSRAKQAKATYDSGVRMAMTNEKGEHEILDDAARASETKRIQTIIESDCN